MVEAIFKDVLLDKLKSLKIGENALLLKQLSVGGYVGIDADDFAKMLNWILRGKVVEETIKGYAEDGTPLIERKERDPTPEEVKQRWQNSGYAPLFKEWLAKGIIKLADLKELFGDVSWL